jgi:hypothetical protein
MMEGKVSHPSNTQSPTMSDSSQGNMSLLCEQTTHDSVQPPIRDKTPSVPSVSPIITVLETDSEHDNSYSSQSPSPRSTSSKDSTKSNYHLRSRKQVNNNNTRHPVKKRRMSQRLTSLTKLRNRTMRSSESEGREEPIFHVGAEAGFLMRKIIGAKKDPVTGLIMYHALWKGFPNDKGSWEPEDNPVENAPGPLDTFLNSKDGIDAIEELGIQTEDIILDAKRDDGGRLSYECRWRGYSANSSKWESEEKVKEVDKLLINRFLATPEGKTASTNLDIAPQIIHDSDVISDTPKDYGAAYTIEAYDLYTKNIIITFTGNTRPPGGHEAKYPSFIDHKEGDTIAVKPNFIPWKRIIEFCQSPTTTSETKRKLVNICPTCFNFYKSQVPKFASVYFFLQLNIRLFNIVQSSTVPGPISVST